MAFESATTLATGKEVGSEVWPVVLRRPCRMKRPGIGAAAGAWPTLERAQEGGPLVLGLGPLITSATQ